MDIVINVKSGTPIYEQIFRQLSAQILNGELNADECLPSIRTVARELGISIITVKSAYEQLEHNGYIYTQAGKGCFVCPQSSSRLIDKKFSLAEQKLQSAIEECSALGLSPDETAGLFQKLIEK